MGLTQREQGFSSFIFAKKLVISKDLSNWDTAEGFIQRIQLAFRFNPFLALNFRSCKILPRFQKNPFHHYLIVVL